MSWLVLHMHRYIEVLSKIPFQTEVKDTFLKTQARPEA